LLPWGEHVVSLFFTNIARIAPVRVCYILSSIFNYNHYSHVPSLSTDLEREVIYFVHSRLGLITVTKQTMGGEYSTQYNIQTLPKIFVTLTLTNTSKNRILINDNTFVYAIVADPGAYDQAALAVGASAAQREQIVTNHMRLQTDYQSYLTVQQVSKDFIICTGGALGELAIQALNKPYVAYSNSTVQELFTHLYEKTAEKMTKKDKQEYLNEGELPNGTDRMICKHTLRSSTGSS